MGGKGSGDYPAAWMGKKRKRGVRHGESSCRGERRPAETPRSTYGSWDIISGGGSPALLGQHSFSRCRD